MSHKVDTVKARNPIEKVIGEHVELSKEGVSYKGLCPFHDEKTPSFQVDPHKGDYGLFYCHGCSASGDVINFIIDYFGLEFKAAMEHLGGSVEDDLTPVEKLPAKKEIIDIYAGYEPVIPAPKDKIGAMYEDRVFINNPKKRESDGFIFKPWQPVKVYPYRLGWW